MDENLWAKSQVGINIVPVMAYVAGWRIDGNGGWDYRLGVAAMSRDGLRSSLVTRSIARSMYYDTNPVLPHMTTGQ